LISDSVVAVPTKAKDVKKPEVKPNPPGAKIWKIKKE